MVALYFSPADLKSSSCIFANSSADRPLCSILDCFFSRVCPRVVRHASLEAKKPQTYHLARLELIGHAEQFGHIFRETEIFQRLGHMFASYSLLRLFLGDLVRFGGDHGDEFDTTLDQQVARLLRKGHAMLTVAACF